MLLQLRLELEFEQSQSETAAAAAATPAATAIWPSTKVRYSEHFNQQIEN